MWKVSETGGDSSFAAWGRRSDTMNNLSTNYYLKDHLLIIFTAVGSSSTHPPPHPFHLLLLQQIFC